MDIRRLLQTTVIGLGLAGSSAFATTITQTFTLGPMNTDITDSAVSSSGATGFAFLQTLVPGATLNGVTLRVVINETVNSLSIHNNSATTSQSYGYTTTARFTLDCGIAASGGANEYDGCVASQDLKNLALGTGAGGSGFAIGQTITPTVGSTQILYNFGTLPGKVGKGAVVVQQTIAASGNQTLLPGPPTPALNSGVIQFGTGVLTYDSGSVATTNLSSYNTTGYFDFGYLTDTNQTISNGGGNLAVTQGTKTSATYSVTYDYTVSPVPEPATTAMVGAGLLALAALAKRSRRSLKA
jgi:pectate lyase